MVQSMTYLLNLVKFVKSPLLWGALLCLSMLLGTLFWLQASKEALAQRLEAEKIALTSAQAALEASHEALAKLQAIQELDRTTIFWLMERHKQNEADNRAAEAAQSELEKKDAPTRDFLDTPVPLHFKRLLDEEDCAASGTPDCGHQRPSEGMRRPETGSQ